MNAGDDGRPPGATVGEPADAEPGPEAIPGPRLYGVLGWPIAHSRSPAMFASAFAAAEIDAVYVPFPVPPGALSAAVAGLRALGVAGANVTLPHKTRVGADLDDIDQDARALGAVNVIHGTPEGRLLGGNTDAEGLIRALRQEAGLVGLFPEPPTSPSPAGAGEGGATTAGEEADAVVLGAGGAARAAVLAAARLGARRVRVLARRPRQATELARALAPAVAPVEVSGGALDESWPPFPRLLLQATSATMGDGPAAGDFVARLPLDALAREGPGPVVVDLVYVPEETALLRAARAAGLRTVGGLGMLVHQAALAFETWTGRPAPIDALWAGARGTR